MLKLVMFFLISIVVICVSGVRLLDVLMEFCDGMMGVILCFRYVLISLSILNCMLDVLCLSDSSFKIIIRWVVVLLSGLLML